MKLSPNCSLTEFKHMLIERDCTLVEFGSDSTVTGGTIPEIKVGFDEGGRGRAQPEEPAAGQDCASSTLVDSRPARVARAIIAYAVTGLIGWCLYDLVPPARLIWPALPGFFAPHGALDHAEMTRQMLKIAEDLQTLKSRVDVLEALEQAHGQETKSVPTLGYANRRIDEVKAGVDAQIAALWNQMKEFENEAQAKAQDLRQAATEQPRRPSGDDAEIGRKAASVAAHVEPEWKRKRHRLHDAFDPATNPTAPGAPRPLGGGLSPKR
jgi:hypothetical protein